LCEVARRLETCVGTDGVVGRLGGDEFAVVWRGASEEEALDALAGRIIAELTRTITIGAADLHIGATIGISRAPRDGSREETLMRCADLALYSGKEAGRGGHAFFKQQMYVDAEDYRSLENDVRNALSSDGLALHYQPIIDARSGRLVGREALLRWSHPLRGPIPPDLFVPIIEDAGLIHQIGDWVIREACAEAMRWPGDLRVAVNISAAQLSGSGIAETVIGAGSRGLAPGQWARGYRGIITGDDVSTLAALERLRAIGVRLVLSTFLRALFVVRLFVPRPVLRPRSTAASSGRCEGEATAAPSSAPSSLWRGVPAFRDHRRGSKTSAGGGHARFGLRQQGYLFGRPVPVEELLTTWICRLRGLFSRPHGRYAAAPRDFAAHHPKASPGGRHRFCTGIRRFNPAAPASLKSADGRTGPIAFIF
jgi:hypothetical protein